MKHGHETLQVQFETFQKKCNGNSEPKFGFLSLYALHLRPLMKKQKIEHLIEKSRELFSRFGVKALTMDDIARDLGISKKTIYQLVGDKSALVKATMESYLEEEKAEMDTILGQSLDSVDAMINMVEYIMGTIRDFNPSALHDLQKYYPETWQMFDEYRFNFVLGRIKENIVSGIEQGVYRPDLDPDVVAKFYISSINITMDPMLFPHNKYQFSSIYREFLNYHLRGIVSAKGLKYLEKNNFFKKINE